MTLPIFVTSPLPLPMDRVPSWNESVYRYDSGARQATTGWDRPLYTRMAFTVRNMGRAKQSSLHNFYNERKGKTEPFVVKDPYDYLVQGITQVPSGPTIAANSGFYFVEAHSWNFLPDSANLVFVSALSGTLISGSHYVVSLDNGFVQLVIGKAAADNISASGHYFRKVAFADFQEQSFLWDQFNGSFVLEELLPRTS